MHVIQIIFLLNPPHPLPTLFSMRCGLDRVSFCQTFSSSYLPFARFARSRLLNQILSCDSSNENSIHSKSNEPKLA